MKKILAGAVIGYLVAPYVGALLKGVRWGLENPNGTQEELEKFASQA